MNLSEALRRATATLKEAGIESPRVDAEILAAHVLGVPRSKLILVSTLDDPWFDELIARRAKRIPLQYLTETAPFLDLSLYVGPGVFIPRPETEMLAQWGIEHAGDAVVDLCSGSGAIALAVKHARPQATVYAVEKDPEALVWLHRNAASSGVVVIEGDIRDVPIPAPVDLVLANPPYVPLATPVAEEVRYDPAPAVFGGADGLELIPAVIARAAELLRPGGWFGMEHDESHQLNHLLIADFEDIKPLEDLAGRPRFVTARRRA